MITRQYSDVWGYGLYVLGLFVSFFVFSSETVPSSYIGFLTLYWGVLMCRRMIILTPERSFLSLWSHENKAFSLPERLLRSLRMMKFQYAEQVLSVFSLRAVQAILFIAGIYISWGVFCTISPAASPILESYEVAYQEFLAGFSEGRDYWQFSHHLYAFSTGAKTFCYIFCAVIAFLLTLTYASETLFARLSVWLFIPVVVVSLGALLAFHTIAAEISLPDYHYLRGVGFDQSALLMNMLPGYQDIYTSAFKRLLETGIIGLGLSAFMLFTALCVFCYGILDQGRMNIFSATGIALVFLIFAQDVYVQYIPFLDSLRFLATCLLASCAIQIFLEVQRSPVQSKIYAAI